MAPASEDLEYRSAAAAAVAKPQARLELQGASRPPEPETVPISFRAIDGTRVRVADSQAPDQPTILLTSPWPESVYAFAPIWASLAERFRLFAIDLPGFGASERRPELLSPQAMGAFLVRVIDECDLGSPHIVAPDVGTSAALFAAASSPDSVASLIVGSGGAAVPLALGEPLKGWALDPDLDRFRSMDPARIVSAALDTVAGHEFPTVVREDYLAAYAGDRFFESIAYVRRYPDELPVLAARLQEIETPTLIFAGLRDRVIPLANAEFLAARLRRSRLTTFDTGHFVWEEAPGEYAAMVASWVTDGYRNVHR